MNVGTIKHTQMGWLLLRIGFMRVRVCDTKLTNHFFYKYFVHILLIQIGFARANLLYRIVVGVFVCFGFHLSA